LVDENGNLVGMNFGYYTDVLEKEETKPDFKKIFKFSELENDYFG
jgi:hypothetical protein